MSINANIPWLLLSILFPLLGSILVLILPRGIRFIREALTVIFALVNLLLAVYLFKKELVLALPWLGFGMNFSLRLYHFSSFILAASACFGFLISLYVASFMRQKRNAGLFYSYLLISLTFVNGAVLSDNLLLLLFFWEGLLLTTFGMIALGSSDAFKTAIKAFVIIGITDLCMMLGIGITAYLAGTLAISKIHISMSPLAAVAFLLLVIGAISKAGSMPFHSWIPDAAIDAPLPFMAFLPASLEKLLGIYFLTRICLDMFNIIPQSALSLTLMIIGAITILLAVMMALVQKDYKKLLSYHAISQVGYMILGIGTALPIGIVGGIFHMLNNCLYKSCLFLTGGSVEKQAGTTNLEKLGGLAGKMPITFGCFLITAASISGVPPFNGFFSKELLYDAALERGFIFYAAAAVGSFFTALSFLKLGHAAFLGKLHNENQKVREVGWAMTLPMIVIAFFCILFGVYNSLPINNFIQPVLGERLEGHTFSGFPANTVLVLISVIILSVALISHWFQARIKGSGLKAVDYIHHAPVLSTVYEWAQRRFFDPYDIGLKFVDLCSKVLYGCDRFIDWIYDGLSANSAVNFGRWVRRMHNGSHVTYLGWSLIGTFLVVAYFMLRG